MGRAENDVFNLCRIQCGTFGIPLYRNNIGFDERTKTKYGLKIGSGDGIGIASIIVTQDMVGKMIGTFFSCETKAATTPSDDQWKWHNGVLARGGISVIARSPKDIPDPNKWEFPDARSA